MTFESLGLAPALLHALAEQGYAAPTAIQVAAIPLVLAGKDVLGGAETGTGKTAAFALPLLQKLGVGRPIRNRQGRPAHSPRALILIPTRELAAQIRDNLTAYGKYLPVRITAVFGGVGLGGQLQALQRGTDILVATPGRLIDHLDHHHVDLSHIDTLVLDEADRMLDMGFAPALRKILAALPATRRQTLLFSATFVPEVKALAATFTHDPQEVQVAPPNAVAAGVHHRVHPVEAGRKRDLLLQLLTTRSRGQTLVFARTKHGCDKLAKYLDRHGVRVAVIHGNKSQGQRTRALAEFKRGSVAVLVATDIAARGLDIAQLPVVVNYDLPWVAHDYVHRVGRTGRGGTEGLALSLVSREEEGLLRDIRRLLDEDLTIEPVAGFEPAWALHPDAGAPPPGTNVGHSVRRSHQRAKSGVSADTPRRNTPSAVQVRTPSQRRRKRHRKVHTGAPQGSKYEDAGVAEHPVRRRRRVARLSTR